MKRIVPSLFLVVAVMAGATGPARAAEHLMVIQEVSPGTPGSLAAQYIMLRMTSRSQTLVNGTYLELQNADGTVIGRFGTFDHNVSTAGSLGCVYPNCPAIVIGTLVAQSAFGFSFDQIVDAQAGNVALPLAGGRACFRDSLARAIDCVAWGSFSGANTIPTPTVNGCDADLGAPAAPLAPGFALTRGLFNCASKENSVDFVNRFPHPVANNGGNANTDADADGLVDVLDCDDTMGDAGLYFPLGVADLDVTGGLTATYTWSSEPAPAGTSLVYDLSVMSIQDLRTQSSCDAAGQLGIFLSGPGGVSDTTMQDSTEPEPGQIHYIAVRSRTICGPAPFC